MLACGDPAGSTAAALEFGPAVAVAETSIIAG